MNPDKRFEYREAERQEVRVQPVQDTMYVEIKAEFVRDEGDGRFVLGIGVEPLGEEMEKELNRLFPHHEKQISMMLAREALLAALVK